MLKDIVGGQTFAFFIEDAANKTCTEEKYGQFYVFLNILIS